jgi:hypothetical protein
MKDLSAQPCPQCEVDHLHADLIFAVDRVRGRNSASFEAIGEGSDGTVTFRFRSPRTDEAELVLTCCGCDFEETRSVRFESA